MFRSLKCLRYAAHVLWKKEQHFELWKNMDASKRKYYKQWETTFQRLAPTDMNLLKKDVKYDQIKAFQHYPRQSTKQLYFGSHKVEKERKRIRLALGQQPNHLTKWYPKQSIKTQNRK